MFPPLLKQVLGVFAPNLDGEQLPATRFKLCKDGNGGCICGRKDLEKYSQEPFATMYMPCEKETKKNAPEPAPSGFSNPRTCHFPLSSQLKWGPQKLCLVNS